MRTIRIRAIAGLLVLASLAATACLADTPLLPPKVAEVWSPNKQYCAVMDPAKWTTTVYRVKSSGQREQSWSMYGWFRVAHLADDGEHFVTGHGGINLLPTNVEMDEVMIYFFRRGELLRTVLLKDLIADRSSLKRTASHYLWGSYLGWDRKGNYTVRTVEDKTFAFDPRTGKPAE